MRLMVFSIGALLFSFTLLAQEKRELPRNKENQTVPLSAREELSTFQLDPAYTIELAAAEPEVVDPVCFCFDAAGDLYVVEMRGYPNAGVGTGTPNLAGRIRRLQDTDHDGYFETASTVLDGLRFPCGIAPHRHGFLVGDAPDLFFVSRDGKEKRVLYTGFGNSNIQQMINGLQLHYDGWVYGCNGGNDSPVKSMEKPNAPIVQLRGMHFRFKPDVPGSLEPCSGGGQYGLAVTLSGQWLTCTNSQHLRHIVLPHHYLKRNPDLSVPAVVLDIPDHGAAARVFRISPFEAWRLERTTRRAGGSDAKRFPTTELVPGGYFTSATGLAWHDNQVFVCDPANNLVHRDVLKVQGSTFQAQRHDKDCEFLASTDTWFRPVFLTNGPDGSLYLADFYREIIETPLSLPDDIKAKWNLNSRERGRIWRIKNRQTTVTKQKSLDQLGMQELIQELGSSISWRRDTAFRLLREKDVTQNVSELKRLTSHPLPHAHILALSLLSLCNHLDDGNLESALKSTSLDEYAVRMAALQFCESRRSLSEPLKQQLMSIAEDQHPQVRFQLALSLGSLPLDHQERLQLAYQLLKRRDRDTWCDTALLSSLQGMEWQVLQAILANEQISTAFLERLAQLVGKKVPLLKLQSDQSLKRYLQKDWSDSQLAVLKGMGSSYVRTLPDITSRLNSLIHQAKISSNTRQMAISLLAYTNWKEAKPLLQELLSSTSSLDDQRNALQAISRFDEREVAELLISLWPTWSPTIRREAQEVLLGRTIFIEYLLERAEKKEFAWLQLDQSRREQLLRSRNANIRQRAEKLQTSAQVTSRQQILTRYAPSLQMTANVERGKALFAKHCSTCHQIQGQGHVVGPDLLGALGNKTPEALLIDMLDPNREVDPRYINYLVITKTGRTVTGVMSSESASSITLKRAEGVEETILRSDLEEVQGTGKSLMPENLEEQVSVQDTADIIGYLLSLRSRK